MFNGYNDAPLISYNEFDQEREKKQENIPKWAYAQSQGIQSITHGRHADLWPAKPNLIGIQNPTVRPNHAKCSCPGCYPTDPVAYPGDTTRHRPWLPRTFPISLAGSNESCKIQESHQWANGGLSGQESCLVAEGNVLPSQYLPESDGKYPFYRQYQGSKVPDFHQPGVITSVKTAEYEKKDNLLKQKGEIASNSTVQEVPYYGQSGARQAVFFGPAYGLARNLEKRIDNKNCDLNFCDFNEKYSNVESYRHANNVATYPVDQHISIPPVVEPYLKSVPLNINPNRVPSTGHRRLKENIPQSCLEQGYNGSRKILGPDPCQTINGDPGVRPTVFQPGHLGKHDPTPDSYQPPGQFLGLGPPSSALDLKGNEFRPVNNYGHYNAGGRDLAKRYDGMTEADVQKLVLDRDRSGEYYMRNNVPDMIKRNVQMSMPDPKKDCNFIQCSQANLTEEQYNNLARLNPAALAKYFDMGKTKSIFYTKVDLNVDKIPKSDKLDHLQPNQNCIQRNEPLLKNENPGGHPRLPRPTLIINNPRPIHYIDNVTHDSFPYQNNPTVCGNFVRPECSYQAYNVSVGRHDCPPPIAVNGFQRNDLKQVNQRNLSARLSSCAVSEQQAVVPPSNPFAYNSHGQQSGNGDKVVSQPFYTGQVSGNVFAAIPQNQSSLDTGQSVKYPNNNLLESVRGQDVGKNGSSKISPLRLLRKKKLTNQKNDFVRKSPVPTSKSDSSLQLDVRKFWSTWADEEEENVGSAQMVVLDCQNIEPGQAQLLQFSIPANESVNTLQLENGSFVELKNPGPGDQTSVNGKEASPVDEVLSGTEPKKVAVDVGNNETSGGGGGGGGARKSEELNLLDVPPEAGFKNGDDMAGSITLEPRQSIIRENLMSSVTVENDLGDFPKTALEEAAAEPVGRNGDEPVCQRLEMCNLESWTSEKLNGDEGARRDEEGSTALKPNSIEIKEDSRERGMPCRDGTNVDPVIPETISKPNGVKRNEKAEEEEAVAATAATDELCGEKFENSIGEPDVDNVINTLSELVNDSRDISANNFPEFPVSDCRQNAFSLEASNSKLIGNDIGPHAIHPDKFGQKCGVNADAREKVIVGGVGVGPAICDNTLPESKIEEIKEKSIKREESFSNNNNDCTNGNNNRPLLLLDNKYQTDDGLGNGKFQSYKSESLINDFKPKLETGLQNFEIDDILQKITKIHFAPSENGKAAHVDGGPLKNSSADLENSKKSSKSADRRDGRKLKKSDRKSRDVKRADKLTVGNISVSKPTIKFSIQKSHDLKISLKVLNGNGVNGSCGEYQTDDDDEDDDDDDDDDDYDDEDESGKGKKPEDGVCPAVVDDGKNAGELITLKLKSIQNDGWNCDDTNLSNTIQVSRKDKKAKRGPGKTETKDRETKCPGNKALKVEMSNGVTSDHGHEVRDPLSSSYDDCLTPAQTGQDYGLPTNDFQVQESVDPDKIRLTFKRQRNSSDTGLSPVDFDGAEFKGPENPGGKAYSPTWDSKSDTERGFQLGKFSNERQGSSHVSASDSVIVSKNAAEPDFTSERSPITLSPRFFSCGTRGEYGDETGSGQVPSPTGSAPDNPFKFARWSPSVRSGPDGDNPPENGPVNSSETEEIGSGADVPAAAEAAVESSLLNGKSSSDDEDSGKSFISAVFDESKFITDVELRDDGGDIDRARGCRTQMKSVANAFVNCDEENGPVAGKCYGSPSDGDADPVVQDETFNNSVPSDAGDPGRVTTSFAVKTESGNPEETHKPHISPNRNLENSNADNKSLKPEEETLKPRDRTETSYGDCDDVGKTVDSLEKLLDDETGDSKMDDLVTLDNCNWLECPQSKDVGHSVGLPESDSDRESTRPTVSHSENGLDSGKCATNIEDAKSPWADMTQKGSPGREASGLAESPFLGSDQTFRDAPSKDYVAGVTESEWFESVTQESGFDRKENGSGVLGSTGTGCAAIGRTDSADENTDTASVDDMKINEISEALVTIFRDNDVGVVDDNEDAGKSSPKVHGDCSGAMDDTFLPPDPLDCFSQTTEQTLMENSSRTVSELDFILSQDKLQDEPDMTCPKPYPETKSRLISSSNATNETSATANGNDDDNHEPQLFELTLSDESSNESQVVGKETEPIVSVPENNDFRENFNGTAGEEDETEHSRRPEDSSREDGNSGPLNGGEEAPAERTEDSLPSHPTGEEKNIPSSDMRGFQRGDDKSSDDCLQAFNNSNSNNYNDGSKTESPGSVVGLRNYAAEKINFDRPNKIQRRHTLDLDRRSQPERKSEISISGLEIFSRTSWTYSMWKTRYKKAKSCPPMKFTDRESSECETSSPTPDILLRDIPLPPGDPPPENCIDLTEYLRKRKIFYDSQTPVSRETNRIKERKNLMSCDLLPVEKSLKYAINKKQDNKGVSKANTTTPSIFEREISQNVHSPKTFHSCQNDGGGDAGVTEALPPQSPEEGKENREPLKNEAEDFGTTVAENKRRDSNTFPSPEKSPCKTKVKENGALATVTSVLQQKFHKASPCATPNEAKPSPGVIEPVENDRLNDKATRYDGDDMPGGPESQLMNGNTANDDGKNESDDTKKLPESESQTRVVEFDNSCAGLTSDLIAVCNRSLLNDQTEVELYDALEEGDSDVLMGTYDDASPATGTSFENDTSLIRNGFYECEDIPTSEDLPNDDDIEVEKVENDDKFRHMMQNCLDNAKKFLNVSNLKLFSCSVEDLLELDCDMSDDLSDGRDPDKSVDHIARDVLLTPCDAVTIDGMEFSEKFKQSDLSVDLMSSLDSETSSNLCPEILPVENWPYLEEEVPSSPAGCLPLAETDLIPLVRDTVNPFREASSPVAGPKPDVTVNGFRCQIRGKVNGRKFGFSVNDVDFQRFRRRSFVADGEAPFALGSKVGDKRRKTIDCLAVNGLPYHRSPGKNVEELKSELKKLKVGLKTIESLWQRNGSKGVKRSLNVERLDRSSSGHEVKSNKIRVKSCIRNKCQSHCVCDGERENGEVSGDENANAQKCLNRTRSPEKVDLKSAFWQPRVILFRITKDQIRKIRERNRVSHGDDRKKKIGRVGREDESSRRDKRPHEDDGTERSSKKMTVTRHGIRSNSETSHPKSNGLNEKPVTSGKLANDGQSKNNRLGKNEPSHESGKELKRDHGDDRSDVRNHACRGNDSQKSRNHGGIEANHIRESSKGNCKDMKNHNGTANNNNSNGIIINNNNNSSGSGGGKCGRKDDNRVHGAKVSRSECKNNTKGCKTDESVAREAIPICADFKNRRHEENKIHKGRVSRGESKSKSGGGKGDDNKIHETKEICSEIRHKNGSISEENNNIQEPIGNLNDLKNNRGGNVDAESKACDIKVNYGESKTGKSCKVAGTGAVVEGRTGPGNCNELRNGRIRRGGDETRPREINGIQSEFKIRGTDDGKSDRINKIENGVQDAGAIESHQARLGDGKGGGSSKSSRKGCRFDETLTHETKVNGSEVNNDRQHRPTGKSVSGAELGDSIIDPSKACTKRIKSRFRNLHTKKKRHFNAITKDDSSTSQSSPPAKPKLVDAERGLSEIFKDCEPAKEQVFGCQTEINKPLRDAKDVDIKGKYKSLRDEPPKRPKSLSTDITNRTKDDSPTRATTTEDEVRAIYDSLGGGDDDDDGPLFQVQHALDETRSVAAEEVCDSKSRRMGAGTLDREDRPRSKSSSRDRHRSDMGGTRDRHHSESDRDRRESFSRHGGHRGTGNHGSDVGPEKKPENRSNPHRVGQSRDPCGNHFEKPTGSPSRNEKLSQANPQVEPADPCERWICEVCGFSNAAERVSHIKDHPFHCQSCHLAFKTEKSFIEHLKRKHKDIRNQHHCLLCELSFDTEEQYHGHLQTREHKHLETVEKNTINTLFTLLTGQPCPVLGLVEMKPEWLPNQAGTVHFYHQATPLSLALQYLKMHHDFSSQSTERSSHSN